MQGLTSPKAPLEGGLEVLERPPRPTPSVVPGTSEELDDLAATVPRLVRRCRSSTRRAACSQRPSGCGGARQGSHACASSPVPRAGDDGRTCSGGSSGSRTARSTAAACHHGSCRSVRERGERVHAQRLALRPAAVDGDAQLALLRPPAPSRASAKTLRGTGARRAWNGQGGGGEGAGEGGR